MATWKCSLQGCNVKFSKGSPHEPFCSEAHRSQYLQAYNTKPSLYPNLSNPTPSYNPQYIAQQTQQQQQQQTVYYQQPSATATHPTHTYVNAFPNTVSSHSVGYNPQPPSYNQVVQTQVVQTQSKRDVVFKTNLIVAPSMPADTIWFYNRGEPYYEFTNFAETPVVIDGKEWPTTEYYFQAQKFVSDKSVMEHIRRLPTPRHCFEESRRLESKKRKDWEQVKDGIMEKAVFEKFTQHKKLKEMLLQTGTKTLVERSPYDKVTVSLYKKLMIFIVLGRRRRWNWTEQTWSNSYESTTNDQRQKTLKIYNKYYLFF